jgi:hypothetical protein
MPYLKDQRGHDFIYHQCLKEVIDSYEMDYLGFISSASTLTDTPAAWKKWFAPAGPSSGYFRRLVRCFRDFAGAFDRASSPHARIFFIDAFSRLDFMALFLAIILYAQPTDYFWLLFRYPLPAAKCNLSRIFCKMLQKKLHHRFIVLTDSERIVATFEGLRVTPSVWPIPHTRHSSLHGQVPEKIICWWPGPPREEKGWEEIRRLTHVPHPCASRFTLVAAQSSQLAAGSNKLSVELIQDHLSDEEFTQKMAECQIVFLPYDKEQYYARTSGIFVEAVVASKIPLVKEGSWLADELKRFDLHELILDWSRSDFFAQVVALLENENMQKKLAAMQSRYAEFHCMEEFRRKVYALLDQSLGSFRR